MSVSNCEILKLLEAGRIYPVADSQWVSHVHCVPKKGGITVVPNDKDELTPQRIVTGYRMVIGFRKLNKATRKDHHLNISNHMTIFVYVVVMRIFRMPSCPYFVFIHASTSKHEDIFIVIGFSLEDKRGLSLGELIRLQCI